METSDGQGTLAMDTGHWRGLGTLTRDSIEGTSNTGGGQATLAQKRPLHTRRITLTGELFDAPRLQPGEKVTQPLFDCPPNMKQIGQGVQKLAHF